MNNLERIGLIPPTARVNALRDYYLHNSPMVLDRELGPWRCRRSLMLYIKGWMENSGAPTTRMRRSASEAYALKNTVPIIRRGELITGQPDFRPFDDAEKAEYERLRTLDWQMIPPKRGRSDHLALDYEKLLRLGTGGLITEARERLDLIDFYDGRSAERWELYRSIITELDGVSALAQSYAARARELAANNEAPDGDGIVIDGAGCSAELYELAETLSSVPEKPARTFREALQSVHFFTFCLYGIYSAGRPDQYLLPYYRSDIESGLLTPESAQELIDCFCLQYMNNMSAWAAAGFMLGGRDGDGKAVENELTWHFMNSIGHTRAPDPNVGFCVTEETSPELIAFAAELIKNGCGNPQIWNNDVITASMKKNGYDDCAANQFTHSTCVEITPIGCSGVSITSPYINMLKIFLDALNSCGDTTFDGLFSTFSERFRDYCKTAMFNESLYQLERERNGNDPARISALISDCMERGLSNDSGGARYNFIEPNMLGMTNVIESLVVINELIYKEKRLTLGELREILANNYQGHEELRAYIIHRLPHFGTDTPETNAIAKRTADMVVDTFSRFTTFRGAAVIPGAFSYRDHESNGKNTSASPDGRLSGDTLADGSSPVQGRDNRGPTVSLRSTASWGPSRFLGGISINQKLGSNTPVETIAELIRGFLKTDCPQMQFNIIDTGTLLDAQKNPDGYSDLLVRIGGYSDYFTRIPRRLQDDIISRSRN